MDKPTYRDNGKGKHCKYPKERLPRLAFSEALKLDAYVHVENFGSYFKVRKDNISSLVAEYPNRGFMR
jgi:hypothetical protein